MSYDELEFVLTLSVELLSVVMAVTCMNSFVLSLPVHVTVMSSTRTLKGHQHYVARGFSLSLVT